MVFVFETGRACPSPASSEGSEKPLPSGSGGVTTVLIHPASLDELPQRHGTLVGVSRPRMRQGDVLEFLALMERTGVRVWVDGGWAVDACLGSQTRAHADLDIAVQEHDVPAATAALRGRGYRPVPRPDTSAWNFVLGDDGGRQIDFHVIVFDENGDGVLGPPENGHRYPAGSLTGAGRIGERQVNCVTPEWLVRFHTGYAVDADDWADVSALCERFAIPVPEDYQRFR
ncbi:aminoglycoside nucleotidyltransferase [Nonomuraea phyllanthi]|uniref:Aminoglycoside nucleotidyltransferase n=1 Tax=Nonomuraea phyllanthi TaxID=2219224 RepID=A0A5C4VHF5_9ACTN|nr:aminoglycoside nucleotidyltransferase [Nonomuraea phyllanthi]